MSDIVTRDTVQADGNDIVLVTCPMVASRTPCLWSQAYQFEPDDETVADFAADVMCRGIEDLETHMRNKHGLA